MAVNNEKRRHYGNKVVSLGLKIPESLYNDFKEGAYADGFSVRESVLMLMEKYCTEKNMDKNHDRQ